MVAVQAEEHLLGGGGVKTGAEQSKDSGVAGNALAAFFAHHTAAFRVD
jgi:hypothetical protein